MPDIREPIYIDTDMFSVPGKLETLKAIGAAILTGYVMAASICAGWLARRLEIAILKRRIRQYRRVKA